MKFKETCLVLVMNPKRSHRHFWVSMSPMVILKVIKWVCECRICRTSFHVLNITISLPTFLHLNRCIFQRKYKGIGAHTNDLEFKPYEVYPTIFDRKMRKFSQGHFTHKPRAVTIKL